MTPPAPEVVAVPRLIDADAIAALLDISPRHLARLVHVGEFPRPLRIGNASRWEAVEVATYVERLRAARAKRKRHA